jgi:hypothetical protein
MVNLILKAANFAIKYCVYISHVIIQLKDNIVINGKNMQVKNTN